MAKYTAPGAGPAGTNSRATFSGCCLYIIGQCAGAFIAVMVIALLRALPDMEETEAAEGRAPPIER